VGEPLCAECFDYRGAVLWNAHVPRLWAATVHRLYRELAVTARLSASQLRSAARLSYIKVIEFQARGLVHLHVVLRADGGAGPTEAPPSWLDASVLTGAIAKVVAGVGVAVPYLEDTALRRARWGTQHDVRILVTDGETDAIAIAAYVAKYASKTADGTPWLAHRIRSRAEIEHLALRPHTVAMVRTAWVLGGRRRLAALRLRDHAHTLGYGGQFSSKSVAFSTTFSALRAARAEFVEGGFEPVFDYDGEWRYAGRGYDDPLSDALAATLLEVRLETARRVPGTSANTSADTSRGGSQRP
jgi:hypothetical protein